VVEEQHVRGLEASWIRPQTLPTALKRETSGAVRAEYGPAMHIASAKYVIFWFRVPGTGDFAFLEPHTPG